MNYISVSDTAKKWNISERSVRNYCAEGRVSGAVLVGKTWMIPESAEKPIRKTRSDSTPETLLDILQREKNTSLSGGIYHKVQIELTYNSNHIEGSKLSEDQTRLIFETNTVDVGEGIPVDDIIETVNHFRAIDYVIDHAEEPLTEDIIKELHRILKQSTKDSTLSWFAVGDYKKRANVVGGHETAKPKDVPARMKALHPSRMALPTPLPALPGTPWNTRSFPPCPPSPPRQRPFPLTISTTPFARA